MKYIHIYILQITNADLCLFLCLSTKESVNHPRQQEMVATVVTCGGLCPGLNAVIRELVMMLAQYGVQKIYGIRGGYKGV